MEWVGQSQKDWLSTHRWNFSLQASLHWTRTVLQVISSGDIGVTGISSRYFILNSNKAWVTLQGPKLQSSVALVTPAAQVAQCPKPPSTIRPVVSVVSHIGNLRKTSLQLKSPLGFHGSHFQETGSPGNNAFVKVWVEMLYNLGYVTGWFSLDCWQRKQPGLVSALLHEDLEPGSVKKSWFLPKPSLVSPNTQDFCLWLGLGSYTRNLATLKKKILGGGGASL